MKINEQDVERVIVNPTFTGIGCYPQIIPDKDWLFAAEKASKDLGLKKFLRLMLEELRKSFAEEEEEETSDRVFLPDNSELRFVDTANAETIRKLIVANAQKQVAERVNAMHLRIFAKWLEGTPPMPLIQCFGVVEVMQAIAHCSYAVGVIEAGK